MGTFSTPWESYTGIVMSEPLLWVEDLKTHFQTDRGTALAVDGISFHIHSGETLGVVGESGCGKSVTSLSIMRLVSHPGKIVGGRILFNGRDLLSLSENQMQNVRGNDIAMIFQEPMTSLNPVYTCGYQIDEAVMRHQGLDKVAARQKTVDMLHLVGIPDPKRRADDYPHQLSGGMRQRVMIAMALSCNPDVLIADEPTTALDVTIQAQILDLIRHLQQQLKMAVLLITHDLGVIAEMADRVAVMYAGKIVETACVDALFHNPKHPYTQGLLTCMPRLDIRRDRLFPISGTVPDATRFPPGCRFASRCAKVENRCREQQPALLSVGDHHQAACWLA